MGSWIFCITYRRTNGQTNRRTEILTIAKVTIRSIISLFLIRLLWKYLFNLALHLRILKLCPDWKFVDGKLVFLHYLLMDERTDKWTDRVTPAIIIQIQLARPTTACAMLLSVWLHDDSWWKYHFNVTFAIGALLNNVFKVSYGFCSWRRETILMQYEVF